jgi:hypothetical protein
MKTIALIAGFASMSKQQLFDMAAKHVLANGKPSVEVQSDGYGVCCYSGIGCAAAPFIAPEWRNYSRGGWSHVAYEANCDHEKFFIKELQKCHDGAAGASTRNHSTLQYTWIENPDFIEDYKTAMRQVAADYKLNTEVLDKN